jgi:hypothetical protein
MNADLTSVAAMLDDYAERQQLRPDMPGTNIALATAHALSLTMLAALDAYLFRHRVQSDRPHILAIFVLSWASAQFPDSETPYIERAIRLMRATADDLYRHATRRSTR